MKFWQLGSVLFVCLTLNGCFNPYFPNYCFLPGTLISAPDDDRPIEQITPGQTVYAYDEPGQKVVAAIVDELVENSTEAYISLHLGNGHNLNVTAEHPIGTLVDGTLKWVKAGDLTLDSQLLFQEERLKVTAVPLEKIEKIEQSSKVFNLKVRRYNNSFAEGVLAHFYFPTK